jgi:hypothetical protein
LLGINPIGLIIGGFFLEKTGSRNNMIIIAALCTVLFFLSVVVFSGKKEVIKGEL